MATLLTIALTLIVFHQSFSSATKHQGLIELNNGVIMPQIAAGNLDVLSDSWVRKRLEKLCTSM